MFNFQLDEVCRYTTKDKLLFRFRKIHLYIRRKWQIRGVSPYNKKLYVAEKYFIEETENYIPVKVHASTRTFTRVLWRREYSFFNLSRIFYRTSSGLAQITFTTIKYICESQFYQCSTIRMGHNPGF